MVWIGYGCSTYYRSLHHCRYWHYNLAWSCVARQEKSQRYILIVFFPDIDDMSPYHKDKNYAESHLQTLVSSSQVLNHWHRRAEERRMSEVHRVVETIMGEIEIVTSNSARLTDALCFMFFSLTVITVVLGVLWASKLYSQTLWERAKIKGKHYFIFFPSK